MIRAARASAAAFDLSRQGHSPAGIIARGNNTLSNIPLGCKPRGNMP